VTTAADEPSAIGPAMFPAGPMGMSIRDFLTDGSLASLCAALTALTGVQVELRDEAGRNIVPEHDAGMPWRVLDLEDSREVPPDADRIPISLDGHGLGEIIVAGGEPVQRDGVRQHLIAVARAVSAAAGEVVTEMVELQHRVKELGVLHQLSSLLASPSMTPDAMLDTALDAALDVFDLDAGSIVLLPDDADGVPASQDEADLVHKASRGLSRGWLENPLPLSRDRVFDRIVLGGDVLVIENLLDDLRVNQPERCEREGLASFFSTAMIVRNRPIGVIRLYARTPRRISPPERQLLRSIGEQAGTAVHQARLLRAEKQERRMQRQLRLASAVQHRMLPRRIPSFEGLDIAARSHPSAELAGDFYDLFDVHGRLGIVIGDVVGKGVAAALLMSAVRASLRAHTHHTGSIDRVMGSVNRALTRDTLDNEFSTLWYGLVDPSTFELNFCSAGHEPPLIIHAPEGHRPTDDDVRPLGAGGLVLGVDATHEYHAFTHRLEPGDVLLAHTDGVTDATSFEGERFGWSRMVGSVLAQLQEDPASGADAIVDRVLWDVRRFIGLAEQADDETLVALRVDPSATPGA